MLNIKYYLKVLSEIQIKAKKCLNEFLFHLKPN